MGLVRIGRGSEPNMISVRCDCHGEAWILGVLVIVIPGGGPVPFCCVSVRGPRSVVTYPLMLGT